MEKNEAYGFSQQNQQCESVYDNDNTSVYEELQPVNENIYYDMNNSLAYELQTQQMSKKKEDLVTMQKVQREQANSKTKAARAVLAMAIVIVLALAVTATILSVLLTNKSDMEIGSLEMELATLKAKLNQTGDDFNQEIESLELETVYLKEKLNQTEANSNQDIKSLQLELENLTETLNQTEKLSNKEIQSLQLDIANLRDTQEMDNQVHENLTQDLQNFEDTFEKKLEILQQIIPRGTFENPYNSCGEIPQGNPSGEYWIQANNANLPVQVYCDMTRTCCNITGGLMRVANLDMTDPNQQCPQEFRLVNRSTSPLRTCGHTGLGSNCISTTFPVHGVQYSHVCGKIIGYQFGVPDGFYNYFRYHQSTIDDAYVEGYSLTYGLSPRQHIWSFAATASQMTPDVGNCPCARPNSVFTGTIPPFIGQDYFCDSGTNNDAFQFILFSDDPLWNGQGCEGSNACCSFNNPPWFCKQLPQPTTHDIELRLCGNQGIDDEDSPLEIVQLYIK